MRVTYDRTVDAAYIYLRETEAGDSKAQVAIWAGETVAAGDVILDFDAEGRLIGIEVLGARRALPPDLLRDAERIG